MTKINSYYYHRQWFDFAFENPDIVTPSHTAMFLWFVELNNRMGWSEKFSSPASQTMSAIGLKSYNTYKKVFMELVEIGCVKLISESKNQYTSCVIALSKFDKASMGALDKNIDLLNQMPNQNLTKHCKSTVQSNDSVIKLINKETNKHKTLSEPTASDGIYPACMDLYNSFVLQRTGVGAKFNSLTGASMKKIIAYLKTQIKDKEDLAKGIPDAFQYILSHFELWDSFHQKQLNLNQIESNLINILNSIRNGKPNNGTKQHSAEVFRTKL